MRIATARDAADLFRPCFVDSGGETLAVAYLDAGQGLIDLVAIGPGAPEHVELPVRRIVADALRLGAYGLVIAHDHPSGDPRPSAEDIEASRELADVASRLGIRLHDHLIFGGKEVRSLRELGFL